MEGTTLVVIEHDRGALAEASLEALAAARALGTRVEALTIGADADGLTETLGAHGASVHHRARHEMLTDYAPEAWGEGYATEATELLVAYGFDQLRFNKVVAHAFAFNAASRRVLEKVGFTEEGVDREEAFIDGEYVDVHRYGLLEREWREL